MTIEALLERIAIALEQGNAVQEKLLIRLLTAQQTGTASQTLTGYQERDIEPADNLPKEAETKPEEKPKKEKPKYDFNKEIRQPYVDMLTQVAKTRLGPKETTKLARKLLREFTGQIEEVLSVKTLPEDKYEDFLAAVKEYKSQILNDKYEPIED